MACEVIRASKTVYAIVEGGKSYVHYLPEPEAYYLGKLNDKLGACVFTEEAGLEFIQDHMTGYGHLEDVGDKVKRVLIDDVDAWLKAHKN